MGHLIRERAELTPDRPFLSFGDRTLSFGEVDQVSNQVANALATLGIRVGDRVAIMLPNGLDFPTLWLGVAKLGAVVVPCNPSYQAADLGYILRDSGARLIIVDRERLDVVTRVKADAPALERVLPLGRRSGELLPMIAAAPDGWSMDHLDAGFLVTLQYTSGTTGFPKGCMLTHEFWLRIAGATGETGLGLGPDDVNMVVTPWYYMDATWNMLLCADKGMRLVILPRFSASTFWKSVQENGVTYCYCLGVMPVVLLKQPEDPAVERGHRLKMVSCSGIVPELHAELERRWGVPWREAYGTTEVGGPLLVPFDDGASVGSGALGRPINGYDAKVVDTDGRDVPVGETGELLVRGPGLMRGYWNNPEATAAWLVDGWARTGDLMFKDDRGYFHIVGRLKEMIRRGGENVAAAEVEAVLAQHPAVRGAACVAVKDAIRGEEVKAFVQLQPGHSPADTPPESILGFCRNRLAPFKVPRFLTFIDAFPLTPSQRVEKHKLSNDQSGAYDAITKAWN
ncbi:MAG: AMP-binding protein [Gemmatimonadota bacterium]